MKFLRIIALVLFAFGSIFAIWATCPPSVRVTNAGSPEVIGIYTARGTEAGKMFYKIETEASNEPYGQGIFWDGGIAGGWSITDADSTAMYYSLQDVQYPWQVEVWIEYNGISPVPAVSEK